MEMADKGFTAAALTLWSYSCKNQILSIVTNSDVCQLLWFALLYNYYGCLLWVCFCVEGGCTIWTFFGVDG